MFVDLAQAGQDSRNPGQVLPRKFLGIKPGLSLKKYNIHTVLLNQDTLHISTKCKLILVYLFFCYEKKYFDFLRVENIRHIWTLSDKFKQLHTNLDKFGQVSTNFQNKREVHLVFSVQFKLTLAATFTSLH